ncbi:MAG: immunity protein YezG family protein [Pseudomonadota bacterium]|nr:immunity protein YezG family protein [Pseudomonadota bacterium]
MNRNIEKLYQEIGEVIYLATPTEWEKISVYACIIELDRSISIGGFYTLEGKSYFINVLGDDPSKDLASLFFELYHEMASANSQVMPWNKCLFELDYEGNFDFQFKFDNDYDWSIHLDICSDEYHKLDIETIKRIKSWEGLPEDFDRYWQSPAR